MVDGQLVRQLERRPVQQYDPWAPAASAGRPQEQSWGQDWATGAWDTWSQRSWGGGKGPTYIDKDLPPTWDGLHPEKTWRDYRRSLDHWIQRTDIPGHKHGIMLWKALTGDAKLLIEHLTDYDLSDQYVATRIRGIFEEAHSHISEFEDQDACSSRTSPPLLSSPGPAALGISLTS